MKKLPIILAICLFFITSCAGDLSSDLYSSDSTMSLTLEGTVISVRKIKINDTDKLSDNTVGILAGGATGAVIGAQSESMPLIVGGAIIGGLVGAGVQNRISQATGYEYIVKIQKDQLGDNYFEGSPIMRSAISSARTSGIITVVQNTKDPVAEGQKVYIIVSDKRARIIAHN